MGGVGDGSGVGEEEKAHLKEGRKEGELADLKRRRWAERKLLSVFENERNTKKKRVSNRALDRGKVVTKRKM